MPYRKTIRELEKELHTNSVNGLSEKEAQKRLLENGENELLQKHTDSIWKLFVNQFKDPMVIILIFGAFLSAFLKEYIDASIILAVILMNALIGLFQEYKAEKAIDALKELSSPKAYVIRDGYIKEIDSKELVVGDVVELETGSYIPADIRLLSSKSLKVEESALTGESEAQEKDALEEYDKEILIADQKNMVFMSTFVTYGKARGIVVRCGMDTEVGKIAKMLEKTEDESTPLQKRLAHLSKVLGIISIVICMSMFSVSVLQKRDILDMLLLSISLAVAAIPEGLPAVVTIVLALGVQIMSKNKAIIRKLHAVETLGSVSVICSDKTGTLTQNTRHVESSFADGKLGQYNEELLRGFALCNDARKQGEEILGEATESALLQFSEDKGMHKADEDLSYIRVNEIPFDSIRKRMTTLHQHKQTYIAYTKGALEKVLPLCTHVFVDNRMVYLSEYEKRKILEASRSVSENAQRVLALARKVVQHPVCDHVEEGMCFIGFAGLIDPPRKEVKQAIQVCHDAGIKVVMITGDHPLTAYAIAKQLGIAKEKTEVLSGSELDKIKDVDLQEEISNYRVFARVTPQHKVRLVSAYKKQGEVVSMSGDGVNDAPALKQADIGIAMGKGSDVCKEAGDMVLADDNFATIVKAIEAGRSIYLNIQKAILYLLSCNLGEIMALSLGLICMPHVVSTLSAIQILWVNMVTDAFPALALGVDPKDAYLMKEKPRDAKESLFAHGGWIFTVLNGMFIGTITLVAFRYGLQSSGAKAQTMAFMVLSLSQLFHSLNLRSRTHSIFKVGVLKNKWLILTVLFGCILQIAVCEIPIFHTLLKTVSLNLMEWGIVFGLSMSVIVINEASKWFAKE